MMPPMPRRPSFLLVPAVLLALFLAAAPARAAENPAMVENHVQECENHSIDVENHEAAGCYVPPIPPIAYWRLEETSWTGAASEVKDTSGNNLHGTAVNGAATAFDTRARDGNPGTCSYGKFGSASKQHVRIPYDARLNPAGNFSVAFWARVDGGAGSWRAPLLSRAQNASGAGYGYSLYVTGENKWSFWTGTGDATNHNLIGPAASTGTWTHVVVAFTASGAADANGVFTGTKTLYINGTQAASATGSKYKPNATQTEQECITTWVRCPEPCRISYVAGSAALPWSGGWNTDPRFTDPVAKRCIAVTIANSCVAHWGGATTNLGGITYIGTQVTCITNTTGTGQDFFIGTGGDVGNSDATSYPFDGLVDEVKVYDKALSAAQVAAAYNETHACAPSGPDHYELSLPTTGISCLPATATVTACADSTSPCANKYAAASGKTAQLSTNAGTLAATTVTFDATGTASTTLQYPTAAQGAAATVTLSGEQTPARGPRKCCPDGTACVARDSCTTTFDTAGLVFSTSNTGAAASPPTQVSGRASGTHYLRAVKTNTTTKACESAVSGARNVGFTYTCIDPATCTAGNWMTLGGQTFGAAGTSTAALVFDAATGAAPFTLRYDDAGKLHLSASVSANNGAVLRGATPEPFVVKPAGLCVYSTEALELAECPAGTEWNDARYAGCKAKKRAGETFNLTVRGVKWESDTDTDLCSVGNATTPNYRVPSGLVPPVVITLGREVVAPSGGSGSVGVSEMNITANGWAEVNQSISDVGVFRFTAAPPAYFGETIGAGTFKTNAFGRFRLADFGVTPGNGAMAKASGGLTYTGQPMGYATAPTLAIAPRNMGGGAAVNYRGNFKKLEAAGVKIEKPTEDAEQNGRDGATKTKLDATLATGTLTENGDGTMTYAFSANDRFTYRREGTAGDNALIPPYVSKIQLRVTEVKDGDGAADTAPLPTVEPAGVPIRYGRIRLQNANGSDLLPLPLPFHIQYFKGTNDGWQRNELDTATAISAGNFAFAFPAGTTRANNLAGCETALTVTGTAPDYTLSLAKPGAGNDGWADLTLNLGTASGNACTAVGTANPAATSANAPWLQWNWTGSVGNPTARATFGVYRAGRVIFMRERY